MQQSVHQRPVAAPAVLGLLLIALGVVALVMRQVGADFFASVAAWGWPLFIIVPGVVLLAVSLLPARPHGVGFATAGAIVTAVGSLLLYQSRTGHWESWAYAWALLPMAAGAALVLYGLFAREGGMVTNGLWMAGVAAVLFAVGAWFFEGIFAGQVRPDFADWWPVGVILIGALIAIRAFIAPPEPRAVEQAPAEPTTPDSPGG